MKKLLRGQNDVFSRKSPPTVRVALQPLQPLQSLPRMKLIVNHTFCLQSFHGPEQSARFFVVGVVVGVSHAAISSTCCATVKFTSSSARCTIRAARQRPLFSRSGSLFFPASVSFCRSSPANFSSASAVLQQQPSSQVERDMIRAARSEAAHKCSPSAISIKQQQQRRRRAINQRAN